MASCWNGLAAIRCTVRATCPEQPPLPEKPGALPSCGVYRLGIKAGFSVADQRRHSDTNKFAPKNWPTRSLGFEWAFGFGRQLIMTSRTTCGVIEDSLWVQNDNLWCKAQDV